jgi:hypothetical protein
VLLDLSSKNSDRGMEAQRHFNRTAVLMSMSQHQHDNDCSIANNPNPTETLPLSVQQMIDYMGVALLNNQGLLQHYRSNGSKNAMHCYEQARDKSISTYGDRHPLVAHAINGIAATLLSIQQSGSSTRIAAEPEPVSSSQHNNKSPVVVIGERRQSSQWQSSRLSQHILVDTSQPSATRTTTRKHVYNAYV